MAAHPDQIFIDGVQQRQVASRDKVVAGTFFLDEYTSKLYLGLQPDRQGRPRHHPREGDQHPRPPAPSSEASVSAATRRASGTSVPSPPSVPRCASRTCGSRTRRRSGSASPRPDVVVNRTSVLRAGLLGIHAGTADGFQVLSSRIDGNNWERFNSAPVSGGIKAGRLARRPDQQLLDLRQPRPRLLVRRLRLQHPGAQQQHREELAPPGSSWRSPPTARSRTT